jgi:hypothetical protein
MAKYLPISPKGETVQQQTEKFHLSQYENTKCQYCIAIEQNGTKVSDFTKKILWNIVAFVKSQFLVKFCKILKYFR